MSSADGALRRRAAVGSANGALGRVCFHEVPISRIVRFVNTGLSRVPWRCHDGEASGACPLCRADGRYAQLGPGASRTAADAEDPDSIARPLLSFLSQRAVADEVAHNPPPFHRVGSDRTLRNRWEPHSDFIADVLRFCLWSWHYPAPHIDEVADARDEVIGGPDRVRGLHRLCYWDLTRLLDTPEFRVGLLAAATAEGDPVISEAISDRHRENSPRWKHFYEEFLRTRGLRIRPGITLEDCDILLAAVADGLALRALADPPPRLLTVPGGAACSEQPHSP
jgi:hypothetical protein